MNASRQLAPSDRTSRTTQRASRPGLERLDGRVLLSTVPAITSSRATVSSSGVEQVRFNASFNDPNPGGERVTIDWGDGTHSTPAVGTIDYVPGATGDNRSLFDTHTYANGGTYTVTATVVGSDGSVGQITSTAQIAHPFYATLPGPSSVAGPLLPLYQSLAPFGSGPTDVVGAEVNGLYHAVLGRDPDPAGFAAAVATIRGGTPASAVASGLFHSMEYETNLVGSYYQNDLGRMGSSSEVAAWVGLMQAGMTPEQVAAGFLTSNEFNAHHPNDSSFVLALYEDVLGLPPTASAIDQWSTMLDAGMGRTTAVAAFLSSPIAATQSASAFYTAFLGRPADAPGLQANASLLTSGMSQVDLASAIAGSAEFAARARASVAP